MKIYIYNETKADILVSISSNTVTIQPTKSQVFDISNPEQLLINGDIIIGNENNRGLEATDKHSQIAGIDGEFLIKYGAPEDIDYAFTILPAGEGDDSQGETKSYVRISG